MLRVYADQLIGQAPHFPREIENGIDQYLAMRAAPDVGHAECPGPGSDAPLLGTQ